MNWNLGYNTDLGYTYGYYREQDPAWLDLCALLRGHLPPGFVHEGKLRYLELGCGQGLNLCLMAACHPHIEFVGIDFNPQHIAHGRGLAKAAGLANVRFVEGNFVELGQAWPTELGRFHYATAHGILSWIARPVRAGLYSCLEAALEPGALVYFSYNTLPGWLSTLPVQHLLRLWQVREGLASLAAIDVGRERLMKLIERDAAMTRVLPAMKARLEKFAELDKAYLVNEYMHEEWTTFWFDELATELAPTKLVHLGTATAGDWYLTAMLPQPWKEELAQHRDPIVREVMQDVLINQSFRRDLWARGQAPVWPARQRELLQSQRFVLLSRPQAKEGDNPYKFATSVGEVSGKPEVYAPLYDALQSGPKTLAELIATPVQASENSPTPQPRTLADTLQAVGLMLHAGHVALAHPLSNDKPAKAINRAIAQAVLAGAPYRNLVAGAIPWVITAGEVDLMLLALAQSNPKAGADALGERLAASLVQLGRGLKGADGQPLTTREALTPRARELAQAFLAQTLPTWQRLGVL